MARIDTLGNFLTDVADAIRTKKGTTGTIPANTFDTEITSIEGGSKYAPRYITFQNYKGTELNEELSNLDTSNITSMNSMFYLASNLQSLNLTSFDTSKVTDMSSMFYNDFNLQSLDLSNFDTSKVVSMISMFNYCSKLRTLDLSNFDTSSVVNVSSMFYYCRKLSNIPKLNASKVTNISSFAGNCVSLTDFGGLENLGQEYSTTISANENTYKLDLSTCTKLTEQSLINVLTNLYDIATKGVAQQQCVLGSTNLAKLTSEEGQQALSNSQAKGWSIS